MTLLGKMNKREHLSHTYPREDYRNSKIFHPKGCSSYNAMSPRNVVDFSSEEEAVVAGYRRAKNCK